MAARVITIAQQKGGAGKTTIAAQLAVAAFETGHWVCLLDTDPQRSLTHWYDLRRDTLGTDDATFLLREASGWRVGVELDRLRAAFDVILIDTPPHAETDAKAAIRAADLTIVPVQPSPMDLWATRATMDLAKGEGATALVVLNRMPPRGRLADTVRDQLSNDGLPLAATAMGNRVAFAASLLAGRGVVETDRRSAAAAETLALAAEVLGI